MGRIICELERIYGVRQGSAGKSDRPLVAGKTPQEQVAEQLGISTKDVQRYKKLTTLIPELQDMVDSDQISTSVASRVLARLFPLY